MCRGLAILMNKSGRVICSGISSHSDTAETAKVEDGCLKFEVIVDDSKKAGYVVVIDHAYEDKPDKAEAKQAVLMLPEVRKWVKKHELDVLRYLLNCQTYARRKGSTYNSYQTTKGNTYNSNQTTKGNTYNSNQTTEGDTYNGNQTTKGDTNNSNQTTKGDTNNSNQTTKGDTYNSNQTTGGEWYCGRITLTKYPNVTALIRQAKDDWNLTINELMLWCAENAELVKKELKKGAGKA